MPLALKFTGETSKAADRRPGEWPGRFAERGVLPGGEGFAYDVTGARPFVHPTGVGSVR